MNYAGGTSKYRIPYLGLGDLIDPDQEKKGEQTVDNQLYGAISALGGSGVIREGNYTSVSSGTGYYVRLSEDKTQNLPSIEAFINEIYVGTDSPVIWPSLINNSTNYLFIQLIEDATGNPSSLQLGSVTTSSSDTSATPPDDGLLVASAVLSGTGITLDSSPTGKVSVPSVATHIADNTDPHGSTLYQTNLIASGITVMGDIVVRGYTQVNGDIIVTGDIVADDATFNTLTVNNYLLAYGAYLSNAQFMSGATFWNQSRIQAPLVVSSGVAIDGRDVSADGTTLDTHVANQSNPHIVTAAQLNALPTTGGNMTGDITMASGVAIDGVDPTVLMPLYSGGNATLLHEHSNITSGYGLPYRYIGYSPEYRDTVVSGNASGVFSSTIDTERNAWKWDADGDDPLNKKLILKFIVPEDLDNWAQFDLWNKVSAAPAQIDVTMSDTVGTNVPLSNGAALQNVAWTKSSVVISGTDTYTWTVGEFATMQIDMVGAIGEDALVSDLVFKYSPI